MDEIEVIRSAAIKLIKDAIADEELPAIKRAEMALALLGKAAMKAEPKEEDGEWEMQMFIDDDGEEKLLQRYVFKPVKGATE